MFYTLFLCLVVLFSVIGLGTVIYLIMLVSMKPNGKRKKAIVLPMNEDDRENAGAIGYMIERLELFGEDENVKIIALKNDLSEHKELEKMFERYNIVKFATLGDMPCIMSCLWDK